MASVINANTLTNLSVALEHHYDPVVDPLIRKDSAVYDMFQEDNSFNKSFGGRDLIWALITDRPFNTGARSETGFFPGFSGATNDDIDRITPVEASLGRAYLYADTAFSEQQMADAHKEFEQYNQWGFQFHLKQMQDDFSMQFERQALGDKTGILGTVVSVALVGGNTVVTLQSVSATTKRGKQGTQLLYKNMKVSICRAANIATNARTAIIDTNINACGTAIQKIVATSNIHDIGAAPTITLKGDLTGAGGSGTLAAGDVIIENLSRPSASGGGNSADDSGLLLMDGLFSFIDDGDLTSTLFGITRSTNTTLNAQTDLSTTPRTITSQRIQIMMDRLNRRRGSVDTSIEDEYMFITERGVRSSFAFADGDAAKRYIQEDKAKKFVSGFKDVTMAFLGNDTLLPWVAYNTFPYGQGLLMRKKGMKAMWDIKPGLVKADGLTLRQIAGTPTYAVALQAVGNLKKDEPWLDARFSGLSGSFN